MQAQGVTLLSAKRKLSLPQLDDLSDDTDQQAEPAGKRTRNKEPTPGGKIYLLDGPAPLMSPAPAVLPFTFNASKTSPRLALPSSNCLHDMTRNPLLDLDDYGSDDEDMQEVAETLSHNDHVAVPQDDSCFQHAPSPPPAASNDPTVNRKRDRAGSMHEATAASSTNSQAQFTESPAGKLFGWVEVRSALGSFKRQKVRPAVSSSKKHLITGPPSVNKNVFPPFTFKYSVHSSIPGGSTGFPLPNTAGDPPQSHPVASGQLSGAIADRASPAPDPVVPSQSSEPATGSSPTSESFRDFSNLRVKNTDTRERHPPSSPSPTISPYIGLRSPLNLTTPATPQSSGLDASVEMWSQKIDKVDFETEDIVAGGAKGKERADTNNSPSFPSSAPRLDFSAQINRERRKNPPSVHVEEFIDEDLLTCPKANTGSLSPPSESFHGTWERHSSYPSSYLSSPSKAVSPPARSRSPKSLAIPAIPQNSVPNANVDLKGKSRTDEMNVDGETKDIAVRGAKGKERANMNDSPILPTPAAFSAQMHPNLLHYCPGVKTLPLCADESEGGAFKDHGIQKKNVRRVRIEEVTDEDLLAGPSTKPGSNTQPSPSTQPSPKTQPDPQPHASSSGSSRSMQYMDIDSDDASISPLTDDQATLSATKNAKDAHHVRQEIKQLIKNEVRPQSMQNHFRNLLTSPARNISQIRHGIYLYIASINSVPSDDFPKVPNPIPERQTAPKQWHPTEHRPETRVSLSRSVRQETRELMSSTLLESSMQVEGNLVKDRIPSIETWKINDWKVGRHPGPTVESFYLQLAGKGTWTSWNKRAAEVFVDHFISLDDDHKHYNPETIKKAFRAHLSNLRERYAMQDPSIGDSPQHMDQDRTERRYARRERLLDQRVSAFFQIDSGLVPLKDELKKAIVLLTNEAMSGDESADSSRKQYYITIVEWRSKELSDFLAYMSAMHLCSRYLGNGKYSRGAFPHSRYSSNRAESVYERGSAPKGLPINWYNPSWLDAHPMRRQAIRPTEPVSLALPRGIVREAERFLSVKTRYQQPLPRQPTDNNMESLHPSTLD
ncbi:hypothetical protein F5890DRAFT_1558305 [Lentinula detonsa]|uniref:Uncharacterized protein n=1 Tax=Lentinula detonsa TaxID=2804962 RepID=A0AA38PQ38_9AGAR|nr:hypothetical protein F5890DRAFT_1558305 [Lentinula detonsa]